MFSAGAWYPAEPGGSLAHDTRHDHVAGDGVLFSVPPAVFENLAQSETLRTWGSLARDLGRSCHPPCEENGTGWRSGTSDQFVHAVLGAKNQAYLDHLTVAKCVEIDNRARGHR
jgi:hypothetical protein